MGTLISALLAGSGTGYALANPNVTKDDYSLIQEALSKMGEKPAGVIRIDEMSKPTANGFVNFKQPDQIWLYRNAPVYQSRDPFKIASTLLHENTHLHDMPKNLSNAELELSARQRQMDFLRNAQAAGQWNDKKYLKQLERLYKNFQHQRELELRHDAIVNRTRR